MKKICAVFLILLLVLTGCDAKSNTDANDVTKPVIFTKIDHYLIQYNYACNQNAKDRENYKLLVDSILNRRERTHLTDDMDLNIKYISLIGQTPLFFLVKEFDIKNNDIVFEFRYSANEQQKIISELETELLKILNEVIREDYNEFEKALMLYDYLKKRIEYDYDWYETYSSLSSEEKTELLLNKEDVGIHMHRALTKNKGVCHSYAYLYFYLLAQVGVDSVIVETQIENLEENHAWVQVKLKDNFYHMDLTWDSEAYHLYGIDCLDHFGMTDEERNTPLRFAMIPIEIDIVCNDASLSYLRGTCEHELTKNHKLILTYEDGAQQTIDTQTLQIIE